MFVYNLLKKIPYVFEKKTENYFYICPFSLLSLSMNNIILKLFYFHQFLRGSLIHCLRRTNIGTLIDCLEAQGEINCFRHFFLPKRLKDASFTFFLHARDKKCGMKSLLISNRHHVYNWVSQQMHIICISMCMCNKT